VSHAECFSIQTEGTYPYNDVVAALLPTGLSRAQIDGLSWQDGAYRVFTCANPPPGRATQIDVVIHRFQNASSAIDALPYFSDTYDTGVNESRSCVDAGAFVICVTGMANMGSPHADVQFVLNQVKAAAGS
jgi:hypothetical protein